MEVGDWRIPISTDIGVLAYTDLQSLIIGYTTIAYGVSHATLASAYKMGHI